MSTGGRVVAGWILEERLGSGGFGEVWKVRRQHVDLHRALKLIRITDGSRFESWRHEISRLEALSHPNIVRFYDADIVSDGPYSDHAWIATELCDHSLAQDLRRREGGLLPERECEKLLTEMLAALAAAESSSCVHRDVKPANILWHDSGAWKLCDFGTARLVPSGATHPETQVVGTYPYMSPAAHHGHQDHFADLYALGVTIHEALCAELLHPRAQRMTDSEYLRLVMDTPPTISARLPRRWRTVVEALTGVQGRHGASRLASWFRETRGHTTSALTGGPGSRPTQVYEVTAATQVRQPTVRRPSPPTPGSPVLPPGAPAAPAWPPYARPQYPMAGPVGVPPAGAPGWPVGAPGWVGMRRDPTVVMGRRSAAFAIDSLLFGAAVAFFFFLALANQYTEVPESELSGSDAPCAAFEDTSASCVELSDTVYVAEDFPWLTMLAWLVPVGQVVIEGLAGGSLGKLAVGLRTVRADGRPAGVGRAFVRWLLWIVDGVPWCFPLVGLLVASGSRGHRRVGDMAAGTYVVSSVDAGRPVSGG